MNRQRRYRPSPPGGIIPVVVPGDVVLVREAGLVVWAGAITAFPEGFLFTLLTLIDSSRDTPPDFALDTEERHTGTWLEIRYSDGRHRAADLNANTPADQPQGPHLTLQSGLASSTEGWHRSVWWVTPMPPPGPVELTVYIGGRETPGTGILDGALLANAASRTQAVW